MQQQVMMALVGYLMILVASFFVLQVGRHVSRNNRSVSLPRVLRTMRTGDLVLFRSRTGIRNVVLGYTHVGMVVGDRVVEAHAAGDAVHLGNARGGVFSYDLAERVSTYDGEVYVARLLTRPRDPGSIERIVREWSSSSYDADHATWIVGSCVLGLPMERPRGVVFCSEMIVRVLQRAGIVSTDVDASCTTPDHLASFGVFGSPRRIVW